tara:strand:- start:965 stop:1195 length:231 start_codon:yes stop_codon:yes gene_type:complete
VSRNKSLKGIIENKRTRRSPIKFGWGSAFGQQPLQGVNQLGGFGGQTLGFDASALGARSTLGVDAVGGFSTSSSTY